MPVVFAEKRCTTRNSAHHYRGCKHLKHVYYLDLFYRSNAFAVVPVGCLPRSIIHKAGDHSRQKLAYTLYTESVHSVKYTVEIAY